MQNWQLALLIGLTVGVIGAYWVSRAAEKKQPIKGGSLARAIHYLACAFQTASAPSALAAAILSRGLHLIPRLLTAVGLAFGCIGASLLLLVILAALEDRAELR